MEARKLTVDINADLKRNDSLKQMGLRIVCHLASVHFCFQLLSVAGFFCLFVFAQRLFFK